MLRPPIGANNHPDCELGRKRSNTEQIFPNRFKVWVDLDRVEWLGWIASLPLVRRASPQYAHSEISKPLSVDINRRSAVGLATHLPIYRRSYSQAILKRKTLSVPNLLNHIVFSVAVEKALTWRTQQKILHLFR